jgi:hypothetical protein
MRFDPHELQLIQADQNQRLDLNILQRLIEQLAQDKIQPMIVTAYAVTERLHERPILNGVNGGYDIIQRRR